MNDIFVCDLNALADLIADKLMKRLDASAPQQQDVYTIQQLAERYHVSEDSIRRRINAGEFGAPIRFGEERGLRVSAEAVRKYDENRSRPKESISQRHRTIRSDAGRL